jgi:hypothetical protein
MPTAKMSPRHARWGLRHSMNANPLRKPPAIATSESQGLEDQIRKRAYELYEARVREDEHELEDWFRAKEEITIKKVRTATN